MKAAIMAAVTPYSPHIHKRIVISLISLPPLKRYPVILFEL